MNSKNRRDDKKLDNEIKKSNSTIKEICDNINKVNSNIKELDKDTRRGNKILSGLTFMLLALTLVESTYLFKLYNIIQFYLLGGTFLIFWIFGAFLLISEGINWIREWRSKTNKEEGNYSSTSSIESCINSYSSGSFSLSATLFLLYKSLYKGSLLWVKSPERRIVVTTLEDNSQQ